MVERQVIRYPEDWDDPAKLMALTGYLSAKPNPWRASPRLAPSWMASILAAEYEDARAVALDELRRVIERAAFVIANRMRRRPHGPRPKHYPRRRRGRP